VARYARFDSLAHPEVATIIKEKLLDLILFHTDIMITLTFMCLQYVLLCFL
jgi:hypothetical protein